VELRRLLRSAGIAKRNEHSAKHVGNEVRFFTLAY
jgi:hypothetical protein